jgi:hypothetical protein
MKYAIVTDQMVSDNTAEYGFGDYADRVTYMLMVVEAETERKAQNAAKKLFPRLRFGGQFGARVITENYEHIDVYKRPADPRLTARAQELHNAALKELA